ncbi:hypothetical protein CY35_18G066100 [Sphagnum magellanicum]|nr:hypothetical protein CY35_18G066100 [Sphagnum magellanicum]
MEDEKFGISGADVTRYALSLNTIKDKHMHSSAIGADVETGSTVESDLNTNATSLLDLLGNRNNEDIKDIQERETFSNTEEGQESRQRTTGASFIPDLKPTTQNAYGGGIYGTEEVPSPRRAARASNSQSADGPISETPAHKDVKMHLSGDRGQDITVYSHGHLYVAISRVTSNANIKIFSDQGPDGYMRNVIYKEVWKCSL